MKLYKNIIVIALVGVMGCSDDFLDLKPTDKISANDLFSNPDGVKAFMAGLYHQLPIEDFNSDVRHGLSFNSPWPNNAGQTPIVITDDAIASEYDGINYLGGKDFYWWIEGFKLNRDINILFDVIPTLNIDQDLKDGLYGEASFMRAYTYYALAKRYGGVPIISEIADIGDDNEALNIPRSTEKETWDFVLASCDTAVLYLGDGDGTRRRATKWAALALKSRAALHAASVAKYWTEAPLSGAAVDAGAVGMDASEANRYYEECISASEDIINNGPFSLFQASPGSPDEAAENYMLMFQNPNLAMNEVIFLKEFALPGDELGSNQDNWGQPNQTRGTWPHPGRFNPSLDLVDIYENYSDPGYSAPVVTTVDGDVLNYDGYDPGRTYLEYDHPLEIFADKDARMRASIVLPKSIWKNTEIIIQGGYIQPDGTAVIESPGEIEVGGVMYYTYGASIPSFYSGFSTAGFNHTRSGFSFKKFLDPGFVPSEFMNLSTTDWIDFRLAEIILNHAEAVAESGSGDAALAAKGINDLRHRAAHQNDIPFTLENVLRERRVELVFEHKRYWDLIRRREYHTAFFDTYKHSLVPIYDLRVMKYIFVRKNAFQTDPYTFLDKWYYKTIPGVETSGLIQNPQY